MLIRTKVPVIIIVIHPAVKSAGPQKRTTNKSQQNTEVKFFAIGQITFYCQFYSQREVLWKQEAQGRRVKSKMCSLDFNVSL